MKRLKELRIGRRLNQDGLAMKLNLSQSTVSAYEVGERTPDLETLIAIANFFNVSIDFLVGLSDVKVNINHGKLKPDEIEHLSKYKKCSSINREKIKAYMDGLLSK